MDDRAILKVIEALGTIILDNQNDIDFKNLQLKNLRDKIEELEKKINNY